MRGIEFARSVGAACSWVVVEFEVLAAFSARRRAVTMPSPAAPSEMRVLEDLAVVRRRPGRPFEACRRGRPCRAGGRRSRCSGGPVAGDEASWPFWPTDHLASRGEQAGLVPAYCSQTSASAPSSSTTSHGQFQRVRPSPFAPQDNRRSTSRRAGRRTNTPACPLGRVGARLILFAGVDDAAEVLVYELAVGSIACDSGITSGPSLRLLAAFLSRGRPASSSTASAASRRRHRRRSAAARFAFGAVCEFPSRRPVDS